MNSTKDALNFFCCSAKYFCINMFQTDNFDQLRYVLDFDLSLFYNCHISSMHKELKIVDEKSKVPIVFSCSENSSDKKAQRPLAAFIPQDMNNLNGGSSTFAERARSMLFPVSKGGPLRGRSPVPSGSRSVDLCASPSESDRLANQKKGHSGRAVTVSDVSTVNSLCQHLSAS